MLVPPTSRLLLLSGCIIAAIIQVGAEKPANPPNPSHHPKPSVQSSVWQKTTLANDDEVVVFSLSLKGERFDNLEQKMTEIAKSRGKWLSTEELKYYVGASKDTKTKVEAFLTSNGVASDNLAYDHLGGTVRVKTNAATVSKMLNATLHHYEHKRTTETSVKASSFDIPDELKGIIVNVNSLTTLDKSTRSPKDLARKQRKSKADQFKKGKAPKKPHKKSPKKTYASLKPARHSQTHAAPHQTQAAVAPVRQPQCEQDPTECDDHNLSYKCIAKKYGYDGYAPEPYSEHVAVILLEQWRDTAIEKFIEAFAPQAKGFIPAKAIIGPDLTRWDNVKEDDLEGVQDTEILIATAWPLNITAYASTVENIDQIKALIALPDDKRPGVVSFSWGEQETLHTVESSVDFCNQVQQLSALGTTFLVGTGDNGVSMSLQESCPPFRVDFQSACPYVVAVGATAGYRNERAAFTETADPSIYNGWSSGGFSNHFPVPEYQRTHVTKYLEKTRSPYGQYFNDKGRGFPDLSAYGNYIGATTSDRFFFAAGTSASAPLTAGLLGLVNAKCKEKGLPRVGWIHPTLYSHPEATHDITFGGTYMCLPGSGDEAMGFPCQEGWDPVTGMGTPRFEGLLKAFGCD